MRKASGSLLVVTAMFIVIWGSVEDGFATGPSSADIQIVPVTYNDYGTILFKTRYSINYTGDHIPMKTEYGWLVVSSNGRWEEHPHITFDPIHFQHDDQRMLEEYKRWETEFDSPFNWASPPKSVQPLLREYTFQDRDISPTYQKEDILSAIQEMITVCVECETRQRSLHNLIAPVTDQDTLEIEFYHEGIVLLQNVDTEYQHIGATFGISNFMDLDGIIRDYGIEYKYIDGIFILSPPAEWFHAHTRAMYIFKPSIRSVDGEARHIVCMKTPTSFYQTCVKQTLRILDIQGALATEGDYIYLLLREEELLPFFRKISIWRMKEYSLTENIIEFRDVPTSIYVVNEEGRELQHKEKSTHEEIIINKIHAFHNLYQHVVNETPRIPTLQEIEQVFLRK
jgi:hypothetical protein